MALTRPPRGPDDQGEPFQVEEPECSHQHAAEQDDRVHLHVLSAVLFREIDPGAEQRAIWKPDDARREPGDCQQEEPEVHQHRLLDQLTLLLRNQSRERLLCISWTAVKNKGGRYLNIYTV